MRACVTLKKEEAWAIAGSDPFDYNEAVCRLTAADGGLDTRFKAHFNESLDLTSISRFRDGKRGCSACEGVSYSSILLCSACHRASKTESN